MIYVHVYNAIIYIAFMFIFYSVEKEFIHIFVKVLDCYILLPKPREKLCSLMKQHVTELIDSTRGSLVFLFTLKEKTQVRYYFSQWVDSSLLTKIIEFIRNDFLQYSREEKKLPVKSLHFMSEQFDQLFVGLSIKESSILNLNPASITELRIELKSTRSQFFEKKIIDRLGEIQKESLTDHAKAALDTLEEYLRVS